MSNHVSFHFHSELKKVTMKFLILLIAGAFVTFSGTECKDFDDFIQLGSYSPSNGVSWIYYLGKEKVNNSDAIEICRNRVGGRLAAIFTREEDEYIRLNLQIEGITEEYVHTSGTYNDVTDRWEWTSANSPVEYSRWNVRDPEVRGRCLTLAGELTSYGWYSNACANNYYFLCQY